MFHVQRSTNARSVIFDLSHLEEISGASTVEQSISGTIEVKKLSEHARKASAKVQRR